MIGRQGCHEFGCTAIAALRVEHVDRAGYGNSGPVQDMGVNHRRRYVGMPRQFLQGADIVAIFQQVRCKRMTQRVAVHFLADVGSFGGLLDLLLQYRFVEVMTQVNTAAWITRYL